MKETIIVLICAIIATSQGIRLNKNGCPLDPNIEKLIPHENCIQFYQCQNGKLVAHTCPEGTFYNSEVLRCDWPENVNCEGRITGNILIPDHEEGYDVNNNENNNNNINVDNDINKDDGNKGGNYANDRFSEAANICATEGSDGTLVAHENCNQFYKCFNGYPVAMYCPGNLLYNPVTKQCDWPDNVNCKQN